MTASESRWRSSWRPDSIPTTSASPITVFAASTWRSLCSTNRPRPSWSTPCLGARRPGTVYVLEPDLDGDATAASPDHAEGSFQGHAMTPDSVFALVRALGGRPRNVTVVGCEPLTFGPENEGCMGLSEPVANAVPEAVAIVEQLLSRLVPTVSAP